MANLKVKADASNFADVVSKANVGKQIEFADGTTYKLVAYFVSNKDRNGNPCKGRQTAVDLQKGNKVREDVSTEDLKREFCPERVQKTHAKPTKKFVCEGLEYGTDAELLKAREAITECLRKRDEERKAQKDKEIKSALNALQGLSKEEILNLLNK